MVNRIIVIFLLSMFYSCASIIKPMTDPVYDLITDYENEANWDSCETSFVTILFFKRIIEQKFPNEIRDLDTLILSQNIIDSLKFIKYEPAFFDSIQFYSLISSSRF